MDSFFNWFAQFWHDNQTLIRIVLVLIGSLVLRAVMLASVKRIVAGVVTGVSGKTGVKNGEESPVEKAGVFQRTRTIGSVLSNFITWGIALVSVTMILNELGVEVGALIAGAGILGAAVGFGAQSLVRDLISGLFIVFEDQYGVGDVVDLGEVISKTQVQHPVGFVHHQELHLLELDLHGTLQVQQTSGCCHHQVGILQLGNLHLVRHATHHVGNAQTAAVAHQIDGVMCHLLRQLPSGT